LADLIKTVRISTDAIAKKDRVEVAREIFGRQILRLELEETKEAPFRANLKLQALPGMAIVTGDFSAARISRTRALLADGNDDLFLTLNQQGPFYVSQRGKEFLLGDGEAVFSSCADLIRFQHPVGKPIGLRIPRAALANEVPNIDDAINRLMPSHDNLVTLLRGYLQIFEGDMARQPPEFAQLAARHIHDLVALSLGARRDFREVAQARGLGAARLHAIKASIAQSYLRHDLSVGMIAAQHGLTPRHVQRLFERAGTTFSQFVQNRRLAHAHALLTDPGHISRNIGEVIFDSGFGDISYFNRIFRSRYGGSPSEIRHTAWIAAIAARERQK
jgi:AraC-like DNA-binding protein